MCAEDKVTGLQLSLYIYEGKVGNFYHDRQYSMEISKCLDGCKLAMQIVSVVFKKLHGSHFLKNYCCSVYR